MRILCLDIETSPNLVATFGTRNVNIGLNQILEPSRMICFAAQWVGQRKVHFWSEYHNDHESMVRAAHDLLSEADVVMGYNSKSFDMKIINWECARIGLGPPEPYDQIDLLTVVRSNFRAVSHKLANISVELDLEGKVSHEGFGLWLKCMEGDDAAWSRMRRYCKRDVTMLPELYEILRPWIKTHPNWNLYGGKGCPNCGGGNLQKRGLRRTAVSMFQRFQCLDCGAYSRSTHRSDSTNRRPE